MPELEIEVLGGDTATATVATTGTLDLEVNLDRVSVTGTVTDAPDVLEVTIAGPVMLQPTEGGTTDPEVVRDTIAAALVAGTGITITVNDVANTITLDATGGGGSVDPEGVRDTVAAALVAGANVTITPNDGADTITIAASTDPEVVRDAIGTALVAGSNVTITPNDAGDTITIAASGTDVEVVRDTIGSALVAGTNVTITPNDAGDTITIAATGTDAEVVRDTIAAALVAGTGVSIVHDDTANTITVATTGGGVLQVNSDPGTSPEPYWEKRTINYAPGTNASEPVIWYSNASGTLKRVYWHNENGVPRTAAAKDGEVQLKMHGNSASQTGDFIQMINYWGGAGANKVVWAIDAAGKPRIGENRIQGANVIILGAADAVPAGLPAGTVIVRTT